jgi:hypothetical protein
MSIWEMIDQNVKIQQETVTHTPLQKLQDAFINILAGGHGVVEINRRVKPDSGLLAAFGRSTCADQTGVSHTLNACQPENVSQMRQALQEIYCRYSSGYSHPYGRSCQLLDVDINWALFREYLLLVKMTHWRRVDKLAATVSHWYTDPKDSRRQAG